MVNGNLNICEGINNVMNGKYVRNIKYSFSYFKDNWLLKAKDNNILWY